MRDALGGPRQLGEVVAQLLLVGAIAATLAGVTSQAHAGAAPPTFEFEKLVNGVDADTAPGVIVPLGSTVTFTYRLILQSARPGGVTVDPINDDNGTPGLTSDDFSPTLVGGDTGHTGFLDPGEIWLFSATTTASLGLVTNVASVTVRDVAGESATHQDVGNYTGVAPVPSPMPLLLLLSGLVPVAIAHRRSVRRTAQAR